MKFPENVQDPIVFVTHDEADFNANDATSFTWGNEDLQPIRPNIFFYVPICIQNYRARRRQGVVDDDLRRVARLNPSDHEAKADAILKLKQCARRAKRNYYPCHTPAKAKAKMSTELSNRTAPLEHSQPAPCAKTTAYTLESKPMMIDQLKGIVQLKSTIMPRSLRCVYWIIAIQLHRFSCVDRQSFQKPGRCIVERGAYSIRIQFT